MAKRDFGLPDPFAEHGEQFQADPVAPGEAPYDKRITADAWGIVWPFQFLRYILYSGVVQKFRSSINFTGAGVVVSDTGSQITVTIAGGGTFYQTMQDEGIDLTQRAKMNFVGAGVTAADSGGVTTVTIPGGGGGGGTYTEAEVDFGSKPTWDGKFTIVDATVGATSKVICVESGNAPTGLAVGEGQWDQIGYSALAAAGSFTLYASASPGPVAGKRKLFYTVAA